jgi:hypothetical protein
MLPADLIRVRRMLHCGQCNRRRNHDRNPFMLTTRKTGVVLITECDGSDPMTLWGGQWRCSMLSVRYTGVSTACWRSAGLFLLLGTKKCTSPSPRSWPCCSQHMSVSRRTRSFFDKHSAIRTKIPESPCPHSPPTPLPRIRRHNGFQWFPPVTRHLCTWHSPSSEKNNVFGRPPHSGIS